MSDVEVVNLGWFRGDGYQDFTRWLEAADGFARYRWGGHIVRMFALALLAEDEQVALVTPAKPLQLDTTEGGDSSVAE